MANEELGFERFTKRHLVRLCKKYHKDCYRLVGQKMELKDQLAQAKEIIKALLKHTYGQNLSTQNDFDLYLGRIKEAEQFLRDTDIDNAIQQANEGLDLDKIADEMEQDLKDSEVENA